VQTATNESLDFVGHAFRTAQELFRVPSLARSALHPLKRLRVRAGCLKGLDFLWLEITRRCNLRCAHCYAGSRPQLPLIEKMQFADWCRVMEEARSLGCRRLQFIGGEPTLHPDLGRLLHYAKRVGFRHCEVFTNATLLRDDLVETFKELGVLVRFSLYSSDPAIHDQITGQAGSFERTVEGIRRLVRRKIRLDASMILMDQNAAQAKQTKRFLRRLGVTSFGTDRVRGIGRGEQLVNGARAMGELCGYCWSGKLCVDASGDAYPCVFSRFVSVGNCLPGGIKDIVKGEKLSAFRREVFLDKGGQKNVRQV